MRARLWPGPVDSEVAVAGEVVRQESHGVLQRQCGAGQGQSRRLVVFQERAQAQRRSPRRRPGKRSRPRRSAAGPSRPRPRGKPRCERVHRSRQAASPPSRCRGRPRKAERRCRASSSRLLILQSLWTSRRGRLEAPTAARRSAMRCEVSSSADPRPLRPRRRVLLDHPATAFFKKIAPDAADRGSVGIVSWMSSGRRASPSCWMNEPKARAVAKPVSRSGTCSMLRVPSMNGAQRHSRPLLVRGGSCRRFGCV